MYYFIVWLPAQPQRLNSSTHSHKQQWLKTEIFITQSEVSDDTWTHFHKTMQESEGSNVKQKERMGLHCSPHLLLVAPPSAWHSHLHHNPVYKLMQDHEQPPPSDPAVWNSEDTKIQKEKANLTLTVLPNIYNHAVFSVFTCSYTDLQKFNIQ